MNGQVVRLRGRGFEASILGITTGLAVGQRFEIYRMNGSQKIILATGSVRRVMMTDTGPCVRINYDNVGARNLVHVGDLIRALP